MNKLGFRMFIIGAFCASLIFNSCSSSEEENSLEQEMAKSQKSNVKVSKEEIDQLIQSFPSPIETSMIIQQAGNKFNSELLLSTKKLDRFVSSYDKALAMGAFGGDMGYINIYEKSFVAAEFLAAIRLLSVDLEIDRFFDFEDMIRMAKSSSNIDSLQQLSTESFNSMEKYLREKGRNELSVLIVFGTWLEGAYIVSYITEQNNTEEMENRVAEQKESVKKIIEILEANAADEYFGKLAKEIKPLSKMYEEIKIETIIREPEMKEIDGQLVFIDKSETNIYSPEGIIEKIILETKNLRNKLLK